MVRPLEQAFRYGGTLNAALLDFAGCVGPRVLDIGCGEGAWAPLLRARGATELVAVEPASAAAAIARTRYDLVVDQPLEAVDLSALGGSRFDTVVAADILEHLVDPWRALLHARSWTRATGHLVVSVPNARFWRLSGALLIRGAFNYSESGLMDWTHLRWFTRSSLFSALRQTGWQPLRWRGTLGGGRRALIKQSLGRNVEELLGYQLQVVARASTERAEVKAI